MRVRINVQSDVSDQSVFVCIVNLDLSGVSVDYKKPLEIGSVNHRMRGFHTSDCVDEFVRLGIEHFHKPIRLGSEEESVSVQIDCKMVEISLLQSGEWNAPNELKRSGVLCLKEKGEGEE